MAKAFKNTRAKCTFENAMVTDLLTIFFTGALADIFATVSTSKYRKNKMKSLKLPFSAMLFMACAASATEQPVYKVDQIAESLEVRKYESYVVAEVVVDASDEEAEDHAFSMLAGYIYGQNKGDLKIELITPVMQTLMPERLVLAAPAIQGRGHDALLVRFMMPKAYSLSTLPEPLDPRVKLREVPSQRVAVIQYSGSWSQSNYDEHLEDLKQNLAKSGLAAQGEPIFARYDSSFTPWFLRTNEIWLKVP